MQTEIRVLPSGAADLIRAEMGGTDEGIPMLYVGPVQVTFYDFMLDEAEMSAWLRRLAAEAERLASLVDDYAALKAEESA